MIGGRFDDCGFVNWLDHDEKLTFINVMQQLLNVEMRFPCPSSSIEPRLARQNVNSNSNTLNQQFRHNIRVNCPLFLTIGIFMFPDEFINQRKINDDFLLGRIPEIQRIVMDITNKEHTLINDTNRTIIETRRGETESNKI